MFFTASEIEILRSCPLEELKMHKQIMNETIFRMNEYKRLAPHMWRKMDQVMIDKFLVAEKELDIIIKQRLGVQLPPL